MTGDLKSITARLKTLITEDRSRQWEIATLTVAARKCFQSTEDWVAWAKSEINIGRRQCFTIQKAVLWKQEVSDSKSLAKVRRVALLELPLRLAEILALIPVEKLEAFLKQSSIDAMDRDELRDAVAAFLDAPRRHRIITAESLPAPEQLILGLDDPRQVEKLDFDTELSYIQAHFTRLGAVLPRVEKSKLVSMRNHLAEDLDILDRHIAGIAS